MINTLKKKIRIDFDKNTKLIYYIQNFYMFLLPKKLYTKDFDSLSSSLSLEKQNNIQQRVAYYNKLDASFTLEVNTSTIKDFIQKAKKNTYFFDSLKYLKYFDYKNKFSFMFGDIIDVPKVPSIVKSRPISEDNQNSVLLKLNKVRHFIFIHDTINFEDKKDLLVWRGKVHQEHRKNFFKLFFENPLFNIGQTNNKKNEHEQWQKEKLSLREHLEYKFLLAIEGNDVASNLKWSMSSNSLVFMVKPKYETWFMEGLLVPNHHYVLLKDNYSDLVEKMHYYKNNTNEAKQIIANAHSYIEQFLDTDVEDIISFKVLDNFFKKAVQ